jgi:hypothetical protein
VLVGYPTEASICRWTPTFDADHPHVVAEGLRS